MKGSRFKENQPLAAHLSLSMVLFSYLLITIKLCVCQEHGRGKQVISHRVIQFQISILSPAFFAALWCHLSFYSILNEEIRGNTMLYSLLIACQSKLYRVRLLLKDIKHTFAGQPPAGWDDQLAFVSRASLKPSLQSPCFLCVPHSHTHSAPRCSLSVSSAFS